MTSTRLPGAANGRGLALPPSSADFLREGENVRYQRSERQKPSMNLNRNRIHRRYQYGINQPGAPLPLWAPVNHPNLSLS